MHELSIAYSLVEATIEAARDVQAQRVQAVHLRLGVFSGVVKEALLFAYDIATEDSILAGSRLEIEDVPLIVFCPECQRNQQLPSLQRFRCPQCNTPTPHIVQGKELEISALEYEEKEAQALL